MKIKRFEFNMFPVNCYVLWDDTKEAVVIDPGCFYEEEKASLEEIHSYQRTECKAFAEYSLTSGPYLRQSVHAERIWSVGRSQQGGRILD